MNEFVFSEFTVEEKLSSWITKNQCDLLFALNFLFPNSFPMHTCYNPFTPCKYLCLVIILIPFFLAPYLLDQALGWGLPVNKLFAGWLSGFMKNKSHFFFREAA